MIDKNKLKEKIQKTSSKDLLYLSVNLVESSSNKSTLEEVKEFILKKKKAVIVLVKE